MQTSNYNPLASRQWYPLMHNHVSWQQASPCLSSFRGLRASTKHSSVQDNKGESDSSPQVSVAGLTTGAQGNPSPYIDFFFFFFHWTVMKKRMLGQKAACQCTRLARGWGRFFCFPICLHCLNWRTVWLYCLKGYWEVDLKKNNNKKNQPSTSRLLNLSVVKGLHDACRSLRWQEARVPQEGVETLLWASQNESDSWGSAFHALPAQSNVTWPVPSGRSSVQ